ncbi:MAG: iron-siderophore ABC transporter substrate-binding protein [Actinobacteria bacterium]|nr:iron-siderophore ABC transporter substrate-binding protein [Actinomycetota bacterium]MBW3651467.1 iron-siderophore ABC transporter substrate-binding protein [Actinomycetota bacterium]
MAVVATACGTDTASKAIEEETTADDGFPVTIEHNYGSTRIADAPERVVSVGYSDHDALLAFGVVPVAVREFFGEQPNATWPWAQDELGKADPVVLDVAELNFEKIASLKPDLIVGVSSGMKDDEYRRLSQIAPTVSRPTQFVDYGVPWQDQTRMIGRALGKQERAEELVTELEGRFAAARKQHPEFEGRTAIVARPSTEPAEFFVFSPQDSRSRFLTSLGFKIDPGVAKLAGDAFTATISTEQLELLNAADVVVWNVDTQADRETVDSNPVYQQLEIKRAGRDLFLDEQTNAALSFSTVLSLPVALDTLVPQLAAKTPRK